jgi:hypothetical protein
VTRSLVWPRPEYANRGRLLEHAGEQRTLREWARHAGLPEKTLRSRLDEGWPLARALATPGRSRRVPSLDRQLPERR